MQSCLPKGEIKEDDSGVLAWMISESSLMRFLSTRMDIAADSDMVRETLYGTAEGIFNQAAVLFRDIDQYVAALPECKERVSRLPCRKNIAGDGNE